MNFEDFYECSLSSPSSSSYSTDIFSSETDCTSSSSQTQLRSHKKTSGRKKFKETRHPIYRGVRARKNNKWVCEVREPNTRAYDVAAIALRGKSAPLNFEDSLWLLPRAKSSSAKDIQLAAAEAVRAFPFPNSKKPSSVAKKSYKSTKQTVEIAEEVSATFFDEEALYYMPALIASMAEGMLLDPPQEGYFYGDHYFVSSASSSSSSTQTFSSESDYTSSSSSSSSSQVSHKKTSGRKIFKETRHPIYRGVRARKNNKWVCEVREPGNSKLRIWLGTHPSAEIAARAYDVAAIALRGKSAPLNFEDSLWLLPRAKSSSAKDIQLAASEAVRAFQLKNVCTKHSSITKKSSKSVTSKSTEWPVGIAGKVTDIATFFDEEALYNMPALIASMAEGMLLDPPQEGYYYDDVENNVDLSLWSDYFLA
ncbi:hypothetical protein MKW92_008757 [Papaver armeniacum]|nr:hypothetical protein MKW92_008757 [Papaver armeniacum]